MLPPRDFQNYSSNKKGKNHRPAPIIGSLKEMRPYFLCRAMYVNMQRDRQRGHVHVCVAAIVLTRSYIVSMFARMH